MDKPKKSRRRRKRLRNEDSTSSTKSPKRTRTEDPRSSDFSDAGAAVLARILGVAAFVLPLFFMKKKQREQRTSDSASNVATEPEEPAFIDTSQTHKPLNEMSEAELSKLASSELELGMDESRVGCKYVDNEKQFVWDLHLAGVHRSIIGYALR
eukprot:686584_1